MLDSCAILRHTTSMPTHRRGRRTLVLVSLLCLAVAAAGGWLSREHLVFWVEFESLGKSDQGLFEYRHRHTGIVMVRIPRGRFSMGVNRDGIGTAEEPPHSVTLSSFLIGKYEVTQKQWSAVMADPSKHSGKNLPVHGVSWYEAEEFCQRVGLLLPLECQWEYACRGGDRIWAYKARPGFQGTIPGIERLDEFAWYSKNSGNRPHPVGEKSPNDFGLYDMLGNAFELCIDVYDREFYSRPEASGMDPLCTSGSDKKVGRGGSFWARSDLQNTRSTYRFPFAPDQERFEVLGFRVAFYPVP